MVGGGGGVSNTPLYGKQKVSGSGVEKSVEVFRHATDGVMCLQRRNVWNVPLVAGGRCVLLLLSVFTLSEKQ